MVWVATRAARWRRVSRSPSFSKCVDPIGPGGLVELVEGANRAVFEKAADPDLRGMGTTLVAMTLRPDEEKVSVVNVGDSRAYLYRDDELLQLTLDHSLVEDLVRQNRLTPDEALTHPQRNILTRALGIASQVDVDSFLRPTEVGDRFLLCSDGLFNEVNEPEITRLLGVNAEPDDAAEALVAAALAQAGRDNVTVAVVDVVEDGRGENVSMNAAETLLVPAATPSAADGGEGNGAVSGERIQGGVDVDVADPEDGFDVDDTTDGQVDPNYGAEPVLAANKTLEIPVAATEPLVADDDLALLDPIESNKSALVPRLVGIGGLVALLVVGYLAVVRYGGSGWYLDVEDGDPAEVALFSGRGFLWVQPERHSLPDEPVPLAELVPEAEDQLSAEGSRRLFSSREAAEEHLESLRLPEEEVTDDTLEEVSPDVSDEVQDGSTAVEDGSSSSGAPPDQSATPQDELENSNESPPASAPDAGN